MVSEKATFSDLPLSYRGSEGCPVNYVISRNFRALWELRKPWKKNFNKNRNYFCLWVVLENNYLRYLAVVTKGIQNISCKVQGFSETTQIRKYVRFLWIFFCRLMLDPKNIRNWQGTYIIGIPCLSFFQKCIWHPCSSSGTYLNSRFPDSSQN